MTLFVVSRSRQTVISPKGFWRVGRSFGSIGGYAPIVLALFVYTAFLSGPAVSATHHAVGWKRNLPYAGLTAKKHTTGMVHATNHVKVFSKTHVDPAQAAAQRLKIQIPSSIAPGPMNTVEPTKTTLFLDKLAVRRAVNPTRFDHYHPVLGSLINVEQLLKGPNGSSAATIALAEKLLLPDTKYYRYFETRRALDPTRFDTYHPLFGPLMAENQRVDNLLIAAQILNPPSPQAVPEPGMITLMMVGTGFLAAGGLRRRAVAACGP